MMTRTRKLGFGNISVLSALFVVGLMMIMPAALADATPGMPSPVQGTVTFNGVVAEGAVVTASWDWYGVTTTSQDTTDSSGVYAVNPYASCAVTITATYNGYNASIQVSTPANGDPLFGKDISIVSPAPVASFTAVPADGVVPLTVQFTDASTNLPGAWQWNFGDGTGNVSTQNPSHTFTHAGDYTVTLTATNGAGSGSVQHTISAHDRATLVNTWDNIGYPSGLVVDADGNVFVSDSNAGRVVMAYPNGSIRVVREGSDFGIINGLAVDSSGNVYVADSSYGVVHVFHPDISAGTVGSGFSAPVDVALDWSGNVYVADAGNNAVYEVFANGTIITLDTDFNGIWGLDVDHVGNVYVADCGGRVKKICADGNILTLASGFVCPSGLAVDANGNVFVADYVSGYYNNVVYEILPDGSMVTLGNGFNQLLSLAVDSHGHLWVGDTDERSNTGRVIEYELYGAVPAVPVAAFSASVSGGVAPLSVQFTDASSSATGWSWDFGDGESSDVQNPVHMYRSAGTYTARLTASNAGGSNSTSQVITVVAPKVRVMPASSSVALGGTRSVDIVVDSLPAGLSGYVFNLTLDNTAVGDVVSVNCPTWDMLFNWSIYPGDKIRVCAADLNGRISAGATDFVLATVTIRATAAGTTGITLSGLRIDDDMADPVIADVTGGSLTVFAPLVAGFSASPLSGLAPLTVQFTDLTTGSPGATAWHWDFGDGGSSPQQSPSHTYLHAGNYTVTLSVSNQYSSDAKTWQNCVWVRQVVEAFPGYSRLPRDLDGDSRYEDVNGNGRIDFDDVVALFRNMDWVRNNANVGIAPYDFNGNGRLDFDDVVNLFWIIVG